MTSDTHGPLPPGWIWSKVREVGDVKLGRQRSPQHHDGPYMRPYLRVANVYENRFDLTDVKTMNFTPSEYETFQLRYGDILLNEGQSLELVGRPAMYRDEVPGACFQNTLIRFRASSAVDPRYALIVFRGYLHNERFRQIARWTTSIAHLGADRFAEVEFPLPPIEEQGRIATRFDEFESDLDAVVAGLKRVQQHLKRYRASVLKAACEGRLVPTEAELARAEGRAYEPADKLLARILEERRAQAGAKYKEPLQPTSAAGLPLPQGWVWATMDHLGQIQGGIQKQPKRAPRENSFPFLRVANVLRGRLDLREVHQVELFGQELARLRLQAGDLLIVEGNGSPSEIGRMAWID